MIYIIHGIICSIIIVLVHVLPPVHLTNIPEPEAFSSQLFLVSILGVLLSVSADNSQALN